MGRTWRATFPLLILPALLGGCGLIAKWFPKKTKPDGDAAKKEIFIGTIELVNPEQRFVLVHTGPKFNLQPGWKLETRPVSGIRSVLTVSPEQKLNFLSADITEGYPQKGEIVVLPVQADEAPAAAAAAAPVPSLSLPTVPVLPPPIP